MPHTMSQESDTLIGRVCIGLGLQDKEATAQNTELNSPAKHCLLGAFGSVIPGSSEKPFLLASLPKANDAPAILGKESVGESSHALQAMQNNQALLRPSLILN